MIEPHPHWIARGSWGSPETHITLRDVFTAECGQCRRSVHATDEACYEESSLDGFPDHGCGAWFTSITSPHESFKTECVLLRPELPYKVLEWV